MRAANGWFRWQQADSSLAEVVAPPRGSHHRRTHRPVAAVPGAAHFAPSVAPVAQTKPARISSAAQPTVSVPVTTRTAGAGPGSPFAPGGPGGPAGPLGPCGPGGPRSPLGPAGPCVPASPCGPCGPTGPDGPGGPAAPSSPTAPCGPTGPCGPWAPWGPAGPTGPGGPASPAGPGGPCGPGAGEQPASATIAMAAEMVSNCRIGIFHGRSETRNIALALRPSVKEKRRNSLRYERARFEHAASAGLVEIADSRVR
jgi:hypothetical protein